MELLFENIKTNEKCPVKLFSFKGSDDGKVRPKHWHESVEFLYCLKGTLELLLEGERKTLEHNQVILINQGVIHQTYSKVENEVIVLQIPQRFIYEAISMKTSYHFELKDKNQEKVKMILRDMIKLDLSENQYEFLMMNSYLLELLYILANDCLIIDHRELAFDKSRRRAQEIMEYCQQHYQEKITLSDIAEQFYISVPHLARLFKEFTGTSCLHYLNTIRLEHAYKQLVYTDISITEIAEQNGFCNHKAFVKSFKEVYNVTPNEYRKSIVGFRCLEGI